MEKRDDDGKMEESDEDAIETFELNEELITRNMSWRSCHFQSLFRFILLNSWVIWKCFKGKSRYRKFIKKLQVELVEKFKEGQKRKKKNNCKLKENSLQSAVEGTEKERNKWNLNQWKIKHSNSLNKFSKKNIFFFKLNKIEIK